MLQQREAKTIALGAGPTGIRWNRSVATAISTLFVIYAAWSVWLNYLDPPGVDFVSFWAAGRMAAGGYPAAAYDIGMHRLFELSVGKVSGLLPFAYPPPFLFVVLPFGLIPFVLAFGIWVVTTSAFYFLAFRRIAPWPYTFAHPAALINALIGQNGFLTSAIFVCGAKRLDERPFLAGAILGLLAIKPQLTLLLPIAVIAGRYWLAIGGAALSAGLLLIGALLAFGIDSYVGFLAILPHFVRYLETGALHWEKLASVFAFCRFLGVPQTAAYAIHWSVAAVAAGVTARAWWLNLETKVPILAAATLLIPPYIWPYDSLLLIIPAGWLITQERSSWMPALLWVLCVLPLAHFVGAYSGPNTIPIAAVLALCLMHRHVALRAQICERCAAA